MIITKKSNGAIVLEHSNGDTETLSRYATLKQISSNEILVRQTQGESVSIFLSGLQTQIEPAVPTNWTGSASALIVYLADNFFFELSGGGSGDLASVLLAGNSAGSSNINMNSKNIDNVKIVDFDSTSTTTPAVGGAAWNDAFGTIAIGLKGGTVKNIIGQQEFARIVNKTVPNVDLFKSNYQVCVVAGATGQRLSVKLAKADSDVNSAGTLGIVAENIAKNQEGYLATFGSLDNIDTTGSLQGETWTDGDILYLSPFTFGAITNIKPSAPNHLVVIGYVEYAHSINGKIFVKIDNGYELDELHNVAINNGTLANNNILAYTSASQVWENKTVETALGFKPATSEGWNVLVKTANQDVIGSTLVDDTELKFSVVAGGNYMVQLILATSGNSTADDYRFDFALSTGLMIGGGNSLGRSAAGVTQTIAINANNAINSSAVPIGQNGGTIPTASGIITLTADFAFYVNSNTTFKVRFACNTGTLSTARTWKGSILKYKRID